MLLAQTYLDKSSVKAGNINLLILFYHQYEARLPLRNETKRTFQKITV